MYIYIYFWAFHWREYGASAPLSTLNRCTLRPVGRYIIYSYRAILREVWDACVHTRARVYGYRERRKSAKSCELFDQPELPARERRVPITAARYVRSAKQYRNNGRIMSARGFHAATESGTGGACCIILRRTSGNNNSNNNGNKPRSRRLYRAVLPPGRVVNVDDRFKPYTDVAHKPIPVRCPLKNSEI